MNYESIKALLVDDNSTNLLILSELLRQRHRVKSTQVSSGIDAIETLKTNRYDIIFMDCMMPDMDGYQTTEAIRSGKAGDECLETPIVAITANAMQEDVDRCLASGMDGFITKPVSPKNIQAALEKWASQGA